MFSLDKTMKYYFCTQPVDMRKSFYTLSGVVRDIMKCTPEDGSVYIFINKSGTTMKILHLEYRGYVIYHKKLDSGSFNLPVYDEESNSFKMSWRDLYNMLMSEKTNL